MAKTVIDIDEEALAAAKAILGTQSKVDTVNQALRELVNVRRRLEALDWMYRNTDLHDESLMRGAWS